MTLEDLAGYNVSYRVPVTGSYRGYDLISSPPPSAGGTHVIELLNIMENFDVAGMQPGSAESLHAWAEAMKLAYGDRAAYMGDPDYVEVPYAELASKAYAGKQFDRIDRDQCSRRVHGG